MDIAGGTVAMTGLVVKSNQAQGGTGGVGNALQIQWNNPAGSGGAGAGGGINVAGGTVAMTGLVVQSNQAQGGNGGTGAVFVMSVAGGTGSGGGINVAGGTVTLATVDDSRIPPRAARAVG